MSEKLWDLPQNWMLTKLDQVAFWGSGGTPSRKNSKFFNGTIPWVKTGELGNKYVRDAEEKITEEAIKKSSAKIFPKGSVGIAMYGATIGKLSIWGIDASTNQACAVAQPFENILHNEYLYYYLASEKRDIINAGKGGAQPNISQGILKEWSISLAPFNEQKRIVAKIEELFSELDKGIESLKIAREKLKIYRQAVLKNAFEGKLTKQWREDNKNTLPTSLETLITLNQERDKFYQQRLKQWQDNQISKKPTKVKSTNEPDVSEHLKEIPESWITLCLENIASEAVLGKMLDKKKNKGIARPYLGNINLRWGRFDLDHLKEMKIEETETERYSLKKGDLVICEGGEPGRCAVWDGEDDVMFIQKALHRVRFTNSYSPMFAYYFMVYAASSGLLNRLFTGTTIKHLTGKGLSQVVLPVPFKLEQSLICEKIEEKLLLIESVEREIETQLQKSETLRQSILKQAFSGKLVAQDPADEPASVLLERIKAKKQNTSKNKKRKAA